MHQSLHACFTVYYGSMNTENTYPAQETFPNRYTLQIVILLLTKLPPCQLMDHHKQGSIHTENLPKKIHYQIIYMHLLQALSEQEASFNGGGVIYCRELSDFGKNVSIHWLVVFKLLKFQRGNDSFAGFRLGSSIVIWDRYEMNQTYYSAMHTGRNTMLMNETSKETFPKEDENS